MYSQILIAVDGSELSERALTQGLTLGKALGIMDEMVGTALDPECLSALRRALERLDEQAVAAA